MTSLPSPRPGSPSAGRVSRIIRVLRGRRLRCGFFCGTAGCLQSIFSSHFSFIFRIYAHPIASVITTQVIVLILSGGVTVSGFRRDRNLAGDGGALGAMPPVNGFITGAAWQTVRLAARLMPRPAGSRWLAEAASFLSEAPPAQRRGALRSYLTAAPHTILVSWAGYLARRTRAR